MTRADLEPGYQIAQSCHALRQFVADHPDIDAEWFARSNYVACLSVRDEKDLLSLVDRANAKGIPLATFREPDLGGQLTAIALAPGEASKRLCSSCKLALSVRS